MILTNIKTAAESVGVNAIITNSNEKIETQLNRLTHEEHLPILLISWDIKATIQFQDNGFVSNPTLAIVCLLLTKPEDTSKYEAESSAEDMAGIYVNFLQALSDIQRPLLRTGDQAITNAEYQLVPIHGAGKHSGVLGRFNVKGALNIDCA